MKYFKQFWYFLFPPDDWRVVWSTTAYVEWTDIKEKDYFFYSILFSESRDKFKLICEGKTAFKSVNAYTHSYYGVALQKLSKFNSELLEIRYKSKNKIK